jgi:hypothetical protein
MHGAPSHRVSATPPAVNTIPNDSRSSLLLQPVEPSRLGTGNTGTQGIASSGQDGINQTQDARDEMTLRAATATPVSQVSVKTEQADPPMWRKTRRKVATRTFPWTLPAAANEIVSDKEASEDYNASNDCSSRHHGDSKGAEPRDDSNEQKPDSKRKRPQDESSPKKFRYSVFWV